MYLYLYIYINVYKLYIYIGYDSFWCCSKPEAGRGKGFNGVCTYARKGLTISADSEPFQEKVLDKEGIPM